MRFKYHLLILLFLIILWITGCSPVKSNPDRLSSDNQLDKATPVVVHILDLDIIYATLSSPTVPVYTPTPSHTIVLRPSTTASVTPNKEVASATIEAFTPSCTNVAEMIKTLNITDNTVMSGGQLFVKMWRIKNNGTCMWTTEYALVYTGGETMGGNLSTPLPDEVEPGESIDLRLDLIAPLYAQSYAGDWMFQDQYGNLFGIGEDSKQPLSVVISVKPTPQATSG